MWIRMIVEKLVLGNFFFVELIMNELTTHFVCVSVKILDFLSLSAGTTEQTQFDHYSFPSHVFLLFNFDYCWFRGGQQ